MRFVEPATVEIRITGLKQHDPKARLYKDEKPVAKAAIELAVEQILELAVPFAELGLNADASTRFYVEAVSKSRAWTCASRGRSRNGHSLTRL